MQRQRRDLYQPGPTAQEPANKHIRAEGPSYLCAQIAYVCFRIDPQREARSSRGHPRYAAVTELGHRACDLQHKRPCCVLVPRRPPGSVRVLFATTSRNRGCECYRIGGVADHVHLAVRLSRTTAIASLIEELKTSSSRWLKTQGQNLSDFAWQRGYGSFSVAPRDLEAVVAYIDDQEEHHRTRTFQEEYRAFLTKYGIEYDERYVWD